jgi:hypothetical protein
MLPKILAVKHESYVLKNYQRTPETQFFNEMDDYIVETEEKIKISLKLRKKCHIWLALV